jgi:hypothetical protein
MCRLPSRDRKGAIRALGLARGLETYVDYRAATVRERYVVRLAWRAA